MTIQMFDAVTVGNIPQTANAAAGYVGGLYPTYWSVVARCPHALHLSIAIAADEDAECLDVEYEDATPAQVPAWVRRQLARGVWRPVVYASVSTMPTILSLLEADGLPPSTIRIWTAHYTGTPHTCTAEMCDMGLRIPAHATQWTDHALGLSLDESLCNDGFFGPPPPPPDPNHYDWYPVGPFPFRDAAGAVIELNERAIVEEYDHLRIHARLNAGRLNELRQLITFLRKRVWYLAHYEIQTQTKRTTPDWGSFHRGWRWQRLLARSRGEMVAK